MELSSPGSDSERPERMLRICHVIDVLRFGGAQRQYVNILNSISGAKRYALILKDAGPGTGLHPYLDPSVEVHSMWVRLRYAPVYVWQIARWLKAQRIDVLHAHMFWPSMYGALAARLAGVPVVITTDHGTSPWKREPHVWLERLTLNRCVDRRLAVSPNVLDVMRQRARVPEEILEPVANATEDAAPIQVVDRRPVRLCAIGRFVWQKDYPTLIDAAAILRDRGLDFRLSIAGDGLLREEIRRRIQALRLERQIELCGIQTDVDAWLRQQDILVLSSVEEGQPMVILEAMARGLPIVATKVGGIPDTVRHEQEALLTDAQNPDALATTIGRMVEDVELRVQLGRRARERMATHFSAAALAQHHMSLYTQILRSKQLVAGAST